MMEEKTIITITRQLGSGGAYIGQIIASRLGLKYYDREIINLISKALNVNEADVAARQEHLTSLFLSWSVFAIPVGAYRLGPLRHISDRELFDKHIEILKDITRLEDCIIVGWAGAYLLPSGSRTTHILFHAPVDFRVKRLMEINQNMSRAHAQNMVAECDSMRRNYFTEMTGKDWMSGDNYHLSCDTSVLPLQEIAETIINYIQRRNNHMTH
jgi:cytidylate kinase